MNTYTRLLICWLACGAAAAAWAGPPQQPDSVQRQAQLKGRLWTVAVQQGWPALAAPHWPTKDSLDSWLTRQPQQVKEVKKFRQDVVDYISKTYNRRQASADELAQALTTQLPTFLAQAHRPLTDAQQQLLSQQLQAARSASETPATSKAAADTLESPAAASAVSTEKHPDTASESASPYLAGLAGVAIGLAAGFVAGLARNQRKEAPRKAVASTAASASAPREKTEKEKLNQEFTDAVRKAGSRSISSPSSDPRNSKQPENMDSNPAPTPDPAASKRTDEQEALPVGAEVVLAVSAPQAAAPAAAACLYGPAPDTPAIEARKFSPQSFPQMPICLTLPSAEATVGSFSLNPHAEQSRLIGNGIRELRTFFDFDTPLPESFTVLTTSRPGTLELRNGSWHLVDKAKIELA